MLTLSLDPYVPLGIKGRLRALCPKLPELESSRVTAFSVCDTEPVELNVQSGLLSDSKMTRSLLLVVMLRDRDAPRQSTRRLAHSRTRDTASVVVPILGIRRTQKQELPPELQDKGVGCRRMDTTGHGGRPDRRPH